MSFVFAEEKCMRALLEFLSLTDVAELVEWWRRLVNSDHEELSDGGCKS